MTSAGVGAGAHRSVVPSATSVQCYRNGASLDLGCGPSPETMFRKMPEDDRRRAGWSVGQAARRLGVSVREYRELEAGERWPDGETFNRICELYGWPQDIRGYVPLDRKPPASVGSASRSAAAFGFRRLLTFG